MSAVGVIGTVAVVVATTEAAQISNGRGVSVTPIIGGFVLGGFLFAIGAANEKLGSQFAALILVTALLINGVPLLGLVTKATSKPQTVNI